MVSKLKIEGDRVIWGIMAVLGILSSLLVFSTSSNLVYLYGGSAMGYTFKHFFLVSMGFVIMYFVHKVPYNYFHRLAVLALPIVILLLFITIGQNHEIQGVNASRWVAVPIINVSLQPSTLALLTLTIYLSWYMSRNKSFKMKEAVLGIWSVVVAVIGLVMPANLSMALLIFTTVVLILYVGGYPLSYLIYKAVGIIMLLLLLFLIAKAFPKYSFSNRMDTWVNRMERFFNEEKQYQVERSKAAILSGRFFGVGPGKSTQKYFVPQSSSDFVFSIIVEEWGIVGGSFVILLYLIFFLRVIIVARKASSNFGRILAAGIGFSIILQVLINISVNLGLMPVTGQNLPILSRGGTSIWVTCLSVGIILSISKKVQENDDAETLVTDETVTEAEFVYETAAEDV